MLLTLKDIILHKLLALLLLQDFKLNAVIIKYSSTIHTFLIRSILRLKVQMYFFEYTTLIIQIFMIG